MLRHRPSHSLFAFSNKETWQKVGEPSYTKRKHGRGRNALNPRFFSLRRRDRRGKKNNTSYNRLQKVISMLRACVSYNRSHSLCLRQERKGRATDRPTRWQRAAAPTQSHSALFTKRRGNPSNSNRCFCVLRRQLTLITSLTASLYTSSF